MDLLPLEVNWEGKKLVLRGGILFGGGHFTAVIRTPKEWMHYDGITTPKFSFYPLWDHEGATNGRLLDKAFYEVLDVNDWRQSFYAVTQVVHPQMSHQTEHFEKKEKFARSVPTSQVTVETVFEGIESYD